MRILMICFAACGLLGTATAQVADPPAFRYQAQLHQHGVPVDGTRDLSFALFDRASGGMQTAATIEAPVWPIRRGLLAIDLSFPDVLQGEQRWLEVRVDGVAMRPRQPVMAVPVARFALVGNRGPAGPQGPQGPTGPQGPVAQVQSTDCQPGNAVQAVLNSGEVRCITDLLHGWSRVNSDVSLPNFFSVSLRPACQPNEVVLGGGVEQLQRDPQGRPANRELQILESLPTFVDGRWAWQTTVFNLGPEIQLRAFATCARA
jgi:hypothetical protein